MKFVKLFEDFEQILNEKASVPKSIIPYIEDISAKVYREILKPLKLGEEEYRNTRNFVYEPDPDFPVNKLEIQIKYETIRNFKSYHRKADRYTGIAIEGSYRGAGDLVQTKKGFVVKLIINIMIGDDFFNSGKFNNKEFMIEKIEALFFHEFIHAYEDIKRITKTGKQLTDTTMQAYVAASSNMRRSPGLPTPLSDFLFLVYAAAAFEVSARNAEIWPKIRKVSDPREREKLAKDTEQWDIAIMLEDFTYEKFVKKIEQEIKEFNSQKPSFSPKIHLKDVLQDIVLEMKEVYVEVSKELADISLSKVFRSMNISSKIEQERIKREVQSNVKKVMSITSNPERFFKNWEKQFHIMGRKAKRKMSKMLTATQD